jgi:hypothetical protein
MREANYFICFLSTISCIIHYKWAIFDDDIEILFFNSYGRNR